MAKYSYVSMTTYQFRVRFFVKGAPITYPGDDQNSFSLPVEGKTFDFSAFREKDGLRGGEWHVITGGGFATDQEAWEAGRRCKNALYMVGVKMRRSLDLGNDKARATMNDALKEHLEDKMRKKGYNVKEYDNTHGLAVYPETPWPTFCELRRLLSGLSAGKGGWWDYHGPSSPIPA